MTIDYRLHVYPVQGDCCRFDLGGLPMMPSKFFFRGLIVVTHAFLAAKHNLYHVHVQRALSEVLSCVSGCVYGESLTLPVRSPLSMIYGMPRIPSWKICPTCFHIFQKSPYSTQREFRKSNMLLATYLTMAEHLQASKWATFTALLPCLISLSSS